MTSPSSSSVFNNQELSPRANVFLLVNLGCEMLFVVDQRLKSQQVSQEKSFQVVHDITTVMLEPKFIESLILGSTHINAQLISAEHCKFMLKDAATSSLMRLDETSMDKLWNLMTMVLKWQIFVSKHPHHLIDVTFRHLNEIGKIQPNSKRDILIEYTKNRLLDFWNSFDENEQANIYRTIIVWLQNFNTKISVLIRLGFQNIDGNFVPDCNASYFQEFMENIGENIYEKSIKIAAKGRAALNASVENSQLNTAKYDVDQLAEMLNFQSSVNGSSAQEAEDLKPIDAKNFQKLFVKNLQQCNILFEDLDVNGQNVQKWKDVKFSPDSTCSTTTNAQGEFVQMQTVYKRENNFNAIGGGGGVGGTPGASAALSKDLLDFYSKMK